MAAPQFLIEPGDVVQLKSGGPAMTVDSVFDEWGVGAALCSWFDGKVFVTRKFPLTSLKSDAASHGG